MDPNGVTVQLHDSGEDNIGDKTWALYGIGFQPKKYRILFEF